MGTLARARGIAIDAMIYFVVLLCVTPLWLRFIALPMTSGYTERQAVLNQDPVVCDETSIGMGDPTPCIIDPWHPHRSPCSPVYWAKNLEDDISR